MASLSSRRRSRPRPLTGSSISPSPSSRSNAAAAAAAADHDHASSGNKAGSKVAAALLLCTVAFSVAVLAPAARSTLLLAVAAADSAPAPTRPSAPDASPPTGPSPADDADRGRRRRLLDLASTPHGNALRGGGGTGTGTGTGGNPHLSYRQPFPASVHSEDFEPIQHPVNEYTAAAADDGDGGKKGKKKKNEDGGKKKKKLIMMDVPKFWDPPAAFGRYGGIRNYLGSYGDRLMTKGEALSIGSTVPSAGGRGRGSGGGGGGGEEGDASSSDEQQQLETIVVALASFRDWMCPHTVENIFARADHPERVRVVVVDQIYPDDVRCTEPLVPCESDPDQALCRYRNHIDGFAVDASLANGPIFARHLGYRMYRGEYFFLQCDAHVQFVRGWDVDVIQQWKSADNEMAVLTTYVDEVQGNINEETGESLSDTRPIMCDSGYEGEGNERHLRHGEMPDYEPDFTGEPQIEPYWAAGFSFGRGHFVVNVPYDRHIPLVFQGEEISIGIRGFTYGYDYYAPERNVCYHYYDRPPNPHANRAMADDNNSNAPKFWDQDNFDEDTEEKAMMRLSGIIHMSAPVVTDDMWRHDDERQFGIGKVRTPELFFKTFGIDTDAQTVEENLCMFVATPVMHRWFTRRLRPDGMGIDYDLLRGFRYRDQWPRKRWWWYHDAIPPEDEEGDDVEKEEEGDDDKGGSQGDDVEEGESAEEAQLRRKQEEWRGKNEEEEEGEEESDEE